MNPRYLSKSRFKLALDCPTKLYYTGKAEYLDSNEEDSLLEALAEGGFQVGALAQAYFPEGILIDELDYEQSIKRTQELLQQENVTLFEPAIQVENYIIRIDVLEKRGNHFNLFEVKAKSISDVNGLPAVDNWCGGSWSEYIFDVCFQKMVLQKAYPNSSINAYLTLCDKSKACTVDGLHQKFVLKQNDNGQTYVWTDPELSIHDLGEPILCHCSVDDHINPFLSGEEPFNPGTEDSFEEVVAGWANSYKNDEKEYWPVGLHCMSCQFDCEEYGERKSGFKTCWREQKDFTEEQFQKPNISEIWNFRGKERLWLDHQFFLDEVHPQNLKVDGRIDEPLGRALTGNERRWLQVQKRAEGDQTTYFDTEAFEEEMETWNWPLHCIDFETTRTAIPFFKGMNPYSNLAFQFSHHILHEDGRVEHHKQWICEEPGAYPNIDFVRQLRASLGESGGSIFRYAPHENTILNQLYEEIEQSDIPDRMELCEWIASITNHKDRGAGLRNMIDLAVLVRNYYYHPDMKGSNSIKAVLPAVLNSSDYLKSLFAQPIYGTVEMPSLNFRKQCWIEIDEEGHVINPYKLLPKVYESWDDDQLEEALGHSEAGIHDGGAAMVAYARMQYTEMSAMERSALIQSLYKYGELDTLAMVMILKEWINQVRS